MRRSCVARGSIEWERGRSFAVNHVVKWRTWTDLRRCVSAGGLPPFEYLGFQFNWLSILFTVGCTSRPTTIALFPAVYSAGLNSWTYLAQPAAEEKKKEKSQMGCHCGLKRLLAVVGHNDFLAAGCTVERSLRRPIDGSTDRPAAAAVTSIEEEVL